MAMFQDWLLKSRKGDACVYYTGNLAYDREKFSIRNPSPRLVEADMAWDAAVPKGEGRVALVTLVQRKKALGVYDYIAQRL